ncbi:MAG: tRNA threonylcarbamoyladenosine dehydratase [Lachnospiraceae bacterium]|nr:tRNA threonylcarbamoyladenosine dehydratase [Lachnospiraceae bacterium]
MSEIDTRTRLILGDAAIEKLKASHVALFGLGGVGGYCLEALVRAGVGELDLYDGDVFDVSNLNRQLLSTTNVLGKEKTEVARERALSIRPDLKINIHQMFYLPEKADEIDFTVYDYVIDAIDTVTAKLSLIEQAKKADVPVISCMGAGNKKDPTAFHVSDIAQTSVCPLAKVMRKELKVRGIENVKVVFSTEPVSRPEGQSEKIGSLVTTVAAAGILLANEVIMDLIRG